MPWSITIGTIAGTAIRIHLTFLLFLVWIGVGQAMSGGAAAGWSAVLFVSLLFGCVVLHEFGHILAARRYGIRTPVVTLYPIGGVASLERLPEKPAQELVVALAGPAVNILIAAVLVLGLGATLDTDDFAKLQEPGQERLAARLLVANVFLAVFNMIPAFPMDGGRVLRAVLAMRLGAVKATRVATIIGQALAVALGFAGFFGNPILIFIAIFVYMAAGAEDEAVAFRSATEGATVADAMVTSYASLPLTATVADAVDCLLRTTQEEFPVVDGWGRPAGILTRPHLIAALRDKGEGAAIIDVMESPSDPLHPGQPLAKALETLQASGRLALPVVEAEGRLVGLLTSANVAEMMMVRAARPDFQFRRRG
jgi:Zn-dependent protease/CBS domain-containing protein